MIGSNRIGGVRSRISETSGISGISGISGNRRIGSNRISGTGRIMSGNIGSTWRMLGTSKSSSGMRMKAGRRGMIGSGWKTSDMTGRCSR